MEEKNGRIYKESSRTEKHFYDPFRVGSRTLIS
jgi:hypothetical protein